MTIFDTAFGHAHVGQTRFLGVACSYTRFGSAAVATKINLMPEIARRDFTNQGDEVVLRERTGVISTDPLGEDGGVASPTERDEVVVNSETWKVAEILHKGGGTARLRLVITQVLDITREGYRGRG